MNHTKGICLFVRILPFRSALSLRLRRHLENCPKCLSRLADVRDARAATVSATDLGTAKELWPRLAPSLAIPTREKPAEPRVRWGWALGTAGLLALTVVGAFFLAPSRPSEVLSAGVKLRVNYVRMYEKPAQAFIFHTQEANSTFVWVEKTKSGEIL
jgi:hypothetical protein